MVDDDEDDDADAKFIDKVTFSSSNEGILPCRTTGNALRGTGPGILFMYIYVYMIHHYMYVYEWKSWGQFFGAI